MSFKVTNIRWESIQLPPPLRANLFMVFELMTEFDWRVVDYHANGYILILEKKKVKMNIYLSTMTIQTSMNHPTKGKTQLNRKKLKPTELKQVFKNPRAHTGKGYHKKAIK